MTFYRMTVYRVERDPDYEQKLEEWRKSSRYGGGFSESGGPTRDVVSSAALEVELSPDEFKAVRDAAVAQWK